MIKVGLMKNDIIQALGEKLDYIDMNGGVVC